MAEHGMLISAGKPVYLTMNTEKWPPATNWAHALSVNEDTPNDHTNFKILKLIHSFY